MRRVSLLTAALFCLALVGQQFAAADETRVKARDKGEEWTAGSVWEGIAKHRLSDGRQFSGPITFEIAKRDGKSFTGRYIAREGKVIFEFDGEVRASGTINITITKIVADSDKFRKGVGRNLVGQKMSGKVDGNSVTLKMVQPDADNPKRALIHTFKLKRKD